jgi:hypothetical protein
MMRLPSQFPNFKFEINYPGRLIGKLRQQSDPKIVRRH